MRLARVRDSGGGGLRDGSPTIVLCVPDLQPSIRASGNRGEPVPTLGTFSHSRCFRTKDIASARRAPLRRGECRASPRLTSPRLRTQISGATGATGATCPRRSSLSRRHEHESGRWIMRRAICWRAVVIGPAALDRFTSIYALSLIFLSTIYRSDLIIYLNYLSSTSPVLRNNCCQKLNVIASWLTT